MGRISLLSRIGGLFSLLGTFLTPSASSAISSSQGINSGTAVGVGEALVVNLLLLSAFAVQHSVMARQGSRSGGRVSSARCGAQRECSLPASCLIMLFVHWRPIPTIVST